MKNTEKLEIILKSYGINNPNIINEIDSMYQQSLMCQKCKELIYSENNVISSADVMKIQRVNFYEYEILK